MYHCVGGHPLSPRWFAGASALWLLLALATRSTRARQPHNVQTYEYTGHFNLTKGDFLDWSPLAEPAFPARKFVVILSTRRGGSTETVREVFVLLFEQLVTCAAK